MDKVYAAEGRFCCSSNDEKNIRNSWFWHVTMASSSEPGCQAPTVTVTQGPNVPFFVFRAPPCIVFSRHTTSCMTNDLHALSSISQRQSRCPLPHVRYTAYLCQATVFFQWWQMMTTKYTLLPLLQQRNGTKPSYYAVTVITTNGVCTSMATTWNYA